jgi:hypothetical protein
LTLTCACALCLCLLLLLLVSHRGEDLFGCEAHFHNWATAAAPYDILLVR